VPRHVVSGIDAGALAAEDDNVSTSPPSNLSIIPTRRLAPSEALEAQAANASPEVASFYSSVLGGILAGSSKSGMGVCVDESMLLCGHGTHEEMKVVDGYVYQLNERVDRLLRMADMANIRLPSKWHPEQLKRIILETVAAGKCMDGTITVLLSLGRNPRVHYGFESNPGTVSNTHATFYVIFSKEDAKQAESEAYLQGYAVKTAPVPSKAPYFARIKSTDRFQDTMVMLDAQAEGCHTGVYVDGEGNVAGAPEGNLAMVKKDGTLVFVESDSAVATISASRLLELVDENRKDVEVSAVEKRAVSLEEIRGDDVVEVMLIGSQWPVMPVVSWDGHAVGDGEVGIVSLQLRTLLMSDLYPVVFDNGSVDGKHTAVPYGTLTGGN
jgi:4-amino-4-deoxychorismate lyase